MKTFKTILENEEPIEDPIEDPIPKIDDNTEDDESTKDSEIGEWVQMKDGWVVKYSVNGVNYTASFYPLDEKQKHWKFTYFKSGQRDSADIKKFGDVSDWVDLWDTIIKIIGDFLGIFKPKTLKFIGMSSSKRPTHYRELYKTYTKNFINSFRKRFYISSFDDKKFDNTPSFVVKRVDKKPIHEDDLVSDYKVVLQTGDKKIYKGTWIQPEQYRKEGDDGKYFSFKVEFFDSKYGKFPIQSTEVRFKDENEGLKWAKNQKPGPGPSDEYIKQFGTASE